MGQKQQWKDAAQSMQESQGIYWPRARRPEWSAATQKSKSEQVRVERIRFLLEGLFYVGLFCVAMFLEVYMQTRLKSYSLNIWMMSRKKAEIESEITKLDMRLTVLESPMRIESLALSEIGLTAAHSQKETPAKKQ